MARELSIEVEIVGTEQGVAKLDAVNSGLQKIEATASKASTATDKFTDAQKEQNAIAVKNAKDMAAISDIIQTYAGPAVVIAAAKQTLAFTDRVQELSDNVKVSAEALQQWGHVAKKNGSTMEAVALAAQRLGSNLVKGSKPIADAVADINLNLDELIALDPETRFRKVAEAIGKIENPAKQARVAQVLLNQSGRDLIATMEDIARGADRNAPKLSNAFVKATADVNDALDDVIAHLKTIGMWFIAWPPLMTQKIGEIGDAWHKAFLQRVFGVTDASVAQSLASATANIPQPGPGFGTPTPAGALPVPNVTIPFRPTGGSAAAGGGRVLPFVPSTLGTSAASIFALGNSPALLPFTLPFMSSAGLLQAGGSPLSFLNGMQVPGTVGMNAPGVGQSLWSRLSGGKLGAGIGAGLGLLSNLIPGLSRTGSSIGATAGSFFGPLGSGIGSIAGGLLGKLFGGNSDKKQISAAMKGEDFAAIKAQAESLGISMDKVFSAKKVKDFEAALKNVSQQITQQESDANKVQEAMDRWGLTVADMGQKFKQTEMNKVALQMAQDFVTLGGAMDDPAKLLEKMGPTLSDFVQQSKVMGTEVPKEMEPVLRAAQKAGLLFDENGEKLTDEAFASVQWAQTMTQGFDKVESAINRLTDAILGIGSGFDEAGAAVERFREKAENIDYGGPVWGEGKPDGFASGGVAGRDFRRPGHGDIFPALLRRGERVLPPGAGSGLSLSIGNLTVGGGYGSRADAVEDIGESVVRYIERRGGRLVA